MSLIKFVGKIGPAFEVISERPTPFAQVLITPEHIVKSAETRGIYITCAEAEAALRLSAHEAQAELECAARSITQEFVLTIMSRRNVGAGLVAS